LQILAGNICIITELIKPKAHFYGSEVYIFDWNTPTMAQEELQITDEQKDRLFFLKAWRKLEGSRGWPDNYEKRLAQYQPGTKEYAQVAVDRIEHFIETQGDE
jgi:hypothetical protein